MYIEILIYDLQSFRLLKTPCKANLWSKKVHLRILRLATIQVGLFTTQALSLLSLPSHSTEHGWKKRAGNLTRLPSSLFPRRVLKVLFSTKNTDDNKLKFIIIITITEYFDSTQSLPRNFFSSEALGESDHQRSQGRCKTFFLPVNCTIQILGK